MGHREGAVNPDNLLAIICGRFADESKLRDNPHYTIHKKHRNAICEQSAIAQAQGVML
jgi:hypothetical protein